MVITLIGLSGSGKSYFAKRMEAEKGFLYRGVDEMIAERLRRDPQTRHLETLADVAQWLGRPQDPGFKEREEVYLRHEKAAMHQCLDELGEDGWGLPQDMVIDTTGSVIYLGDEFMSALAQRSRLIYLAIPESEYAFMFQQYFDDPKPVIWGSSYQPKEGETPEQALRRCYPELIAWRAAEYSKYADMLLVMDRENRDRMSISRFLRLAGAQ